MNYTGLMFVELWPLQLPPRSPPYALPLPSPHPQMFTETQWPGSPEWVSPRSRSNVPDEILERFRRKFTTRNRLAANTASCWFGVICGASEHKSKHLFTVIMSSFSVLGGCFFLFFFFSNNSKRFVCLFVCWPGVILFVRIYSSLHPVTLKSEHSSQRRSVNQREITKESIGGTCVEKKTLVSRGRQRPLNHPPCPHSVHICRLQSARPSRWDRLNRWCLSSGRRSERRTKPHGGGGSLMERGRGADVSNCG